MFTPAESIELHQLSVIDLFCHFQKRRICFSVSFTDLYSHRRSLWQRNLIFFIHWQGISLSKLFLWAQNVYAFLCVEVKKCFFCKRELSCLLYFCLLVTILLYVMYFWRLLLFQNETRLLYDQLTEKKATLQQCLNSIRGHNVSEQLQVISFVGKEKLVLPVFCDLLFYIFKSLSLTYVLRMREGESSVFITPFYLLIPAHSWT